MNIGITFLIIISVVILSQLLTQSKDQRRRHEELKELLQKK